MPLSLCLRQERAGELRVDQNQRKDHASCIAIFSSSLTLTDLEGPSQSLWVDIREQRASSFPTHHRAGERRKGSRGHLAMLNVRMSQRREVRVCGGHCFCPHLHPSGLLPAWVHLLQLRCDSESNMASSEAALAPVELL